MIDLMSQHLPLIWAGVILFSIMMYVVMDGFDLGIGILYPFFKSKQDRDVMMNTIAPVWDGNETWLVMGGAGLLAAFPLAYALVLSALYLPLIFMLMGLVFRGVAFEFRFRASEQQAHYWDKAFILGSVSATFCQGVILGAYIRGIPVVGSEYAGGALDWLTLFSVFCGFGLVVAYALLGSSWLIMKTDGELQKRAAQITNWLSWVLLATIAVISLWTPLIDQRIAERWFRLPNLFWFAPVPILVVISIWQLQRALKQQAQIKPFLYTLALVFLGYSGLGISLWPNVVPPSITIWAASSPPQSQGFTLIGALITIPMILAYTVWAYYVFRGKVTHESGYH